MIEAAALSKFYGDFAAIRDVSFSVPRGQVAAFLGPNGAGKSTTLKILTGFLSPSSGTAKIAGMDVAKRRIDTAAHIGYLPENGPLYPEMTPLELLRFFGEARGLPRKRLKERIDAVIEQCSLQAVVEKSIFKLSKGYRQRAGMAQVLLHEPDVLIMDEPTSGLDPNQIREVRDVIRELGKTKTILLSTHILQEVEAVAGHVILIHEGRIVFDGTPAEMAGGGTLEEAFYRYTAPAPEQKPEPKAAAAAEASAAKPEESRVPSEDANPAAAAGPADEAPEAEAAGEARESAPVETPHGKDASTPDGACGGLTEQQPEQQPDAPGAAALERPAADSEAPDNAKARDGRQELPEEADSGAPPAESEPAETEKQTGRPAQGGER